jgi:16S rRNA (cytosine967-C5)-methyltransferase
VYDAFTVVNQAVDAVRSVRATASHAALVNACLRRYLRERAALHSLAEADWEARYNHPAWWVKRVRRDHPQHWQAILAADNVAAPLVLRVNTARISRDEFMRHLHDAGLTAQAVAHPLAQAAVVLAQPVPVESLPGYAQGWFAVQDTAAQMAAPLLLDGLSGPLRVLDACAAPGGKTAHLLAHAQATGLNVEVLALEVDAARARRIHDNLARLHSGANVQVRVADAAAVPQWWGGEPFDAILLDAPCTASGIVRRHPDVRWLRREADVAALVATQQALLEALWPLLRPGGRMVYCTCSVFRAEGQAQVQAFLQHHTDARQGAAPGHLLPGAGHGHGDMTDNPPGGHDGFFYARFDKVTPIAPALDA